MGEESTRTMTRSEGVQTEPEGVGLPGLKRPSVIEEWMRNPSPEEKSFVIKGDELYEERAVDVSGMNPGPDLIQRREEGEDRGSVIKIKKPQDGGTVRNIPIKDYKASLAAHFGTIRKSAQPQQQFESLVSEPGKGGSRSKERSKPLVQKSNLKLSSPENPISGGVGKRDENGDADLRRGHVVQKISVYEENSRESGKKSLDIRRRGNKLGVPLVGMHNACGLPIVAPWPLQLNIGSRNNAENLCTMKNVIPFAVPAGVKSRNQTKRRAPQRPGKLFDTQELRGGRKFVRKSRGDSTSRDSSNPENVAAASKRRLKNQRQPSFKVGRINATLPARHSRDSSFEKLSRITFRSVKGEAKRNSPLLGSFRRKSSNRGKDKRKTLYAKADGDDAANVLSNLCLNPLARSKEAANMIW